MHALSTPARKLRIVMIVNRLIESTPRILLELVALLMLLAVALLLMRDGSVDASAAEIFVLVVAVIARLLPSSARIVTLFNTIRFNLGSMESIYELASFQSGLEPSHPKAEARNPVEKISVEGLNPLARANSSKFLLTKELNFEFKRGTINLICGPSGIGKTQVLRCLAGINSNYSGKIKSMIQW